MNLSLEESFVQANSLIYRSGPNSHKIIDIKGVQKNLQLKIILLNRRPLIKTKKCTISQFLVADETGAAYMNFFDQFGESLEEGDILYASGVYSSYHKEMLIIFQGSQSIVKRIGKWMMKFSTQTNISLTQNKIGSRISEETKIEGNQKIQKLKSSSTAEQMILAFSIYFFYAPNQKKNSLLSDILLRKNRIKSLYQIKTS